MRISVALAGIWVAGAAAMGSVTGALAACSDDVVNLRGDWGQLRFSVEVADEQ